MRDLGMTALAGFLHEKMAGHALYLCDEKKTRAVNSVVRRHVSDLVQGETTTELWDHFTITLRELWRRES